jgi:hypothetical protein
MHARCSCWTLRFLLAPSIPIVLRQIHLGTRLDPTALAVIHDMICDLISRLVSKATEFAESCEHLDSDEEENEQWNYISVVASPGMSGGEFELGFVNRTTVDLAVEAGLGESLEKNKTVITARHIQAAVRFVFGSELAKHAVSEGTKAGVKLLAADIVSDVDFTNMGVQFGEKCGLQFYPQDVALIAQKFRGGSIQTPSAAVYLTAVCEYITAEILELSGNAAIDHQEHVITPRRVSMAVRNDDELNSLFPGCIRESGVSGVLYPLPAGHDIVWSSPATTAYVALTRSLGAAAPHGVIVDPLTGAHIHPASGAHLPVLDAACGMTAVDRARLATALLSPSQREVVGAIRADAVAAVPSEAHLCHLRSCVTHVIDCSCFVRFAYYSIAREQHSNELLYSAEALSAAQTSCESHLLNMITAVRKMTKGRERARVLESDMKFVADMARNFYTWGSLG